MCRRDEARDALPRSASHSEAAPMMRRAHEGTQPVVAPPGAQRRCVPQCAEFMQE